VLIHELELTVGDVIHVGEYTVTVIDVENDEATLRIQEPIADEESDEGPLTPRPR
jgi:hypothetical protein